MYHKYIKSIRKFVLMKSLIGKLVTVKKTTFRN